MHFTTNIKLKVSINYVEILKQFFCVIKKTKVYLRNKESIYLSFILDSVFYIFTANCI